MEHKFIQANITVLLYLIVLYYLKNAAVSFVEFPRKLFNCVKVYYVFLILLTILGFFKRLFILIRIIVSHWLHKMIGVLFFRNGSIRTDVKNLYWKTRSKSLEKWKMAAQDHSIDEENLTKNIEQKVVKRVSNKKINENGGIQEDTTKVKDLYVCESDEICSKSLRKYRHIQEEDVKWKQVEFITDGREKNVNGTLEKRKKVEGIIEKKGGDMKGTVEKEEMDDKRERMENDNVKISVKKVVGMSVEGGEEERGDKTISKKDDGNDDNDNDDIYKNDDNNNNNVDVDNDKTKTNTREIEEAKFTDCIEEDDIQLIENKIKSLFINIEQHERCLNNTSKTIYNIIKDIEGKVKDRSKYIETNINLPYFGGNRNVNTNKCITDEMSDDILKNRKTLVEECLLHEEIRKDLVNAKLFDKVSNGVNEETVCKKQVKVFYDVEEEDNKEKEKIKKPEKPLKSILKKQPSQHNNTVKLGEEKEKKPKKCIRFNNEVETHFFEKNSYEDYHFAIENKQMLWKFYESYKLSSVDFFDYYKIKNNFKIALTDFLTPLHTYKNKLVSKL